MELQTALLGACILVIAILQIITLLRQRKLAQKDSSVEFAKLMDQVRQELAIVKLDMQRDVTTSFKDYAEILNSAQRTTFLAQDKRLCELTQQLSQRTADLQGALNDQLGQMSRRLATTALENEQKLEGIRKSMDSNLGVMREENAKKLEEMRATVDEKLQKTLEERISKSFSLVNERLEQVYKGLGEMQSLASGVGDLKKILSNVKTRGVLGEVQLGAILEQIMPKEQYEENVAVKKGAERVEYAIRLPGNTEGIVYLPIDAKFPADVYAEIMDAYESGNKERIDAANANLRRTIRTFAKMIHDKYIEPPHTTDFAIMFLPLEGLYAEVVRAGLIEPLQREFKITIAGPTTMAALLNSFQMGFRTLAIQKYSSEVWNILGAIKTEFNKFGDILAATQQKLNQANEELDKLVGVRTRAIQRKLRNVEQLPDSQSGALLEWDAASENKNEPACLPFTQSEPIALEMEETF